VYTRLYKIIFKIPSNKGVKPLCQSRIMPARNKREDIIKTFKSDTLPDGIGLFFVLFINESVRHSEYWLSAADPAARKKTPEDKYNKWILISLPEIKYPVTEDKTTASESLYLIRSVKTENALNILLLLR
jgi:hypothetical protein